MSAGWICPGRKSVSYFPAVASRGRARKPPPVDAAAIGRFRRLLGGGGAAAVDSFAVLDLLKGCFSEPIARQAHTIITKLGMGALYSRTGQLADAHEVFVGVSGPEKNAACWTSLIAACVGNGEPQVALRFFREMQAAGVEPDKVTLTAALSACADLGALASGAWIHAYAVRLTDKKNNKKKSFSGDLILRNALINMYTKCGDISNARRLFDLGPHRDVTTWTSMIVGYALNGRAEEALKLFGELQATQQRSHLVSPNQVTFVGVLMACSHAGRVGKPCSTCGACGRSTAWSRRSPTTAAWWTGFAARGACRRRWSSQRPCRSGPTRSSGGRCSARAPLAVSWPAPRGPAQAAGNGAAARARRRRLRRRRPAASPPAGDRPPPPGHRRDLLHSLIGKDRPSRIPRRIRSL
ncbi:unnamed protein product [Spirodela intermedia]|uniref:Uncharacterized protein n=1 Tax=Spirodela intermedia TaxID=51605 RepID=A0A7I8ILL3_SPIIN|nr:unnamed protein product [Spirodela intermedia]CAA6658735.1 unnamed protein product [Spirodela intermedia]